MDDCEQSGVNTIESLQGFRPRLVNWRILASFCKGNVVSTFICMSFLKRCNQHCLKLLWVLTRTHLLRRHWRERWHFSPDHRIAPATKAAFCQLAAAVEDDKTEPF